VKKKQAKELKYKVLRSNKSVGSRKQKILSYTALNFVKVLNRWITPGIFVSRDPNFVTKLGRLSHLDEMYATFSHQSLENKFDKGRLIAMCMNLESILERGIQGSIVELGVYRGHTLAPLAFLAKRHSRDIFAIDTFGGFSQDQLVGIDSQLGVEFDDTSLQNVQRLVSPVNNQVRYLKGVFPNSAILETLNPHAFCFVHLDCDLYEPSLKALEYFWPRITSGGLIFLHDYHSRSFKGIKQAVLQFELEIGQQLPKVVLPDLSSTLIINKL